MPNQIDIAEVHRMVTAIISFRRNIAAIALAVVIIFGILIELAVYASQADLRYSYMLVVAGLLLVAGFGAYYIFRENQDNLPLPDQSYDALNTNLYGSFHKLMSVFYAWGLLGTTSKLPNPLEGPGVVVEYMADVASDAYMVYLNKTKVSRWEYIDIYLLVIQHQSPLESLPDTTKFTVL